MPDDQIPSPESPEPTNSSYGRLFGAASPPPMPTPPGNWEPPLPDEVSTMLSGYVVTGVLGRGGMGAVYQGLQTSLERPVAIKLLPPELGYDPEFEARFRREAKSMARLNHPNIVQIYDFGTTGSGHHYIVMEFVDGTDLHRLIRSGGLTPEGALNAVSQICDALEYAHGEGFVHRDIKPANIFINNKGILKVGDFGLAKLVEGADESALSATEKLGLTMTGVAMGTPHYIAPEQLAADGTVDRRADIYSLGVMFYEMLTGEIPRGAVKPPSQKVKALDVRLDDVVFRAMEVDPAERYQSATDLRTDVDGIRLKPVEEVPSSESVVTGRRPISSAVPRRERAARDHRVLLWSGIAVALLLAVGVGIWQAVSGDGDGGEAVIENNESPAPVVGPLVFPIQHGDPGRLEAMGVSVTADFLKPSEPYTDFVQVCASSTASGEAVIWAALRQNGEVVFSQGDAHRPTTPARNVALIRSDRGSGFFLIHRDGSLTVTGESAPPPAGLRPVVDAVGGGERIALALHADRTVSVWGKSHGEWPVPVEALRDVVSLSTSRYGAMTVTADGALHRWGRDYPYRRIEPLTGDPFVEVMGVWTVPQEGKVRSRSGKLFSMEGVPAVTEVIAYDLAYGGPVFYRDRQGFWRPMADGGAEFQGLPEFSEGHEVAAFVSAKKSAAMLRIVPVTEDLPTLKSLDQWLETEHEYEPLNDDSEENFRISKNRIVYLNDDGSEKTPYLLTITGARSAEFAYTTGKKVPISFSEDFSRVQRLATKTTNYALKVDGAQLGDTGGSATARVTGRGGILRGLYYDQEAGKVIQPPIPDDWKEKPVVKVGSHNYGEGRWWAIAEDGEVLRFDGEKRITGEMEARIQATAFDWERMEAWVKLDGSLGAASRLQPVPAGNDFIDVKVGNAFALGLRKSGEVVVWFEKDAPDDRFVPGPEDLRDAVAIEASGQKGAILKKSGELVWWDLKEGMLPTSIPDGKIVTALSGNHDSVLILTSDGSYQHPNAKPITGKGAATAIRAGHALSAFRTKEGTWAFRKGAGADEAPGALLSAAIREHQTGIDASLDLAFTVDGSKNRGVVLWIEPGDLQTSLTSSPTSQTLFDRIAGKKYYRATNAANWLSFGAEPGQMVLRDLEGKDIVYECKALSGNEIEWRWSNGDQAVARFDEDLNRVTLPTGVAFSTTPGLVFATEAEELAHYVGGSEWQVESKDKPYSIWFNESATSFRTASGEEYPLTDSGKPFRKLFRWQNVDSDNFVEFKQTYEIGYFFDANTGDGAVVMKRQGAVPRNMPVNEGSDLTSSSANTDLFARISGKKYYRATNAAEWFRFGPEPGKMVLHNLHGKDNFYQYKALSENEIEWRFSGGPVTGRFEEGVERFVLPDDTFFSTTPGPAFATETEEIAHHVGGSEWRVESKTEPYSIWFNESATAIRTKAGPEYSLKHSEQSYRLLFRWKDAGEDNEIKFDLTYESGHFFDAAAKEGSVPMKRLGAVPGGATGITNATPAIRSGRLRAFGVDLDGDRVVPIKQPDEGKDYVACSSESGPWQAVRANGDLVVGHERHRPDPPFTTIPPEGLIGSQNVALNREGRLLTWSDHIRNRVGELERVELFDAQHRFAAAKFKNGDIRIWNILPDESPDTYQPTREALGDVVKIVASNCGVTFLRRDGTILFCNQTGVRKTLVDRDRFVEIDNVVNGFVGLTENGEVKDWGDSDRVEARDDLSGITAIRGGGRIVAALREDGTWTSWAADDTQEGAKALQEKLSTIRGAIDLDVYADKQVARMAWIEPVETTKSPPAEAVTSVRPTATEMPGRAAVPADAITNRIAGIDAAYHQRYEAEVTKPHAEAVEKLNGQISAALQREQDAASKAGELDEVLQWRRSIDRLGSGKGVPTVAEIAAEAPPVVRPPKLLGFYATYRDLLGKLEAARDEKVKPLRAARDQALDQYQRELTQAGDIDGALRVKAAREAGVAEERPVIAEPAAATPIPEPKVPMAGPASDQVKGDPQNFTQGRLFFAMGSNLAQEPFDISAADGISDFVDVSSSGGSWAALRSSGEVIGWSKSTGAFSRTGIDQLVHRCYGTDFLCGITRAGGLMNLISGETAVAPVAGKKVVDAAILVKHNLALFDDGTVTVWGEWYEKQANTARRFPAPPKATTEKISHIGGSRYEAWVITQGGDLIGWGQKEWVSSRPPNDLRRLKDLWALPFYLYGSDARGRLVKFIRNVEDELEIKEETDFAPLLVRCCENGTLALHSDAWHILGDQEAVAVARLGLAEPIAALNSSSLPLLYMNEDNNRGHLLWLSAGELKGAASEQPKPGGLLLLGYRQIEDGTKEEDLLTPELKPGEKVVAVAARNRHGGGYAVWTDQKRRVSRMGDMEVDDGRLIAGADSDFQHGFLMRDGTLKLSSKPVPGMADELKGIVDFDINGYSAVAVKRDGGVIVWNEDAGPDRIFQPDRQWLGDLVAARSGFEPGHWWFLRRDGTAGHSGIKGVILDSAFSEPVHVIAPTRVSACLALTRDGRIIHNAEPNFTNPLLLKQIPNDRGTFVDLRCGGDVAAAQRSDGSWIAWGSDRAKDLALFRELESAGHVRDLRIKGVGGNTTPNGTGNLVIVGIQPEGE